MTDRSTGALDPLEVAIRRLRFIGAVLLIGVTITGRTGLTADRNVAASLVLAVLPVILLATNALGRALRRHPERSTAVINLQLAVDAMVTVCALWVLDPTPGNYALMAASLPVLHGALRYRLSGAFAVWLAVGAGLVFQVILGWEPGNGLQPLFDLAIPLAISLAVAIPAGHLADQLSHEIVAVDHHRQMADQRARLLAVLTIANQELATGEVSALASTATDAAAELGFAGSALIARTKGDLRVVWAAGRPLRSPHTVAFPEAALRLGHPVVLVEGEWLVQLQTGSTEIFLHTWSDSNVSITNEHAEAFGLLSRQATTAFTTSQGVVRLRKASERHRYDATHDHLTSVLNRAGLLEVYAARQAARTEDSDPFALLVLDLDGFKAVNDTYGHDAGDVVLVAAAKRLTGIDGGALTVARSGGDEFVLLAPIRPDRDVTEIAAAIEHSLSQPFRIEAQSVSIGASVGWTIVSDQRISAVESIRLADREMYTTKRERQLQRGPYPVHPPI